LTQDKRGSEAQVLSRHASAELAQQLGHRWRLLD
jgi:hypothetical protein